MEADSRDIRFITYDEALRIHRLLLEEHGGLEGVRDRSALKSALAMPQ